MIVLPIVDRELRVAARRVATYRTRIAAALAAIILVAWKCLDFRWRGATSASQGQSLFYTLSSLAFIYSLCIGARVTSDCVSEEKREGTLGLLFLTDLKGLDVVLGKLVANSLNSFYGLLAVLPLLAVPLLLGGVTLVQYGHMVVVLLNAMFFSLSVGIFVSALSRNERKSLFGTMVLILAPTLIPFCIVFFIVAVLELIQTPAELMLFMPLLMANPIYPFLASLPLPALPFISFPTWTFWMSVGIVHVFSWLSLLVTAFILPMVWKDRPRAPKPAKGLSMIARWQNWARGNFEQRQRLRNVLLGRNPFLWLVSRDRLKPGYAWLFLLAMLAVWLWGYWHYGQVMYDFYPLVPTIFLVHCFLKVWIISEVSHRLVEDQRNGAMELLLSTPLTMQQIFRGQQMALVRQFGFPVLALCLIELWAFRHVLPVGQILPVQAVLVADLFTLMWLSMRLSLTARSINEVLLKSLLLVLVLPWVLYFLVFPFWQFTWRYFQWGRWRIGFSHQVYVWFAVCMLNNLVILAVLARSFITRAGRQPGSVPTNTKDPVPKWTTWTLRPETND